MITNVEKKKPEEIIEPDISLNDEGQFIRIVATLPGIAEEKVKIYLDTEKTIITILASDKRKRYKKVMSLPGKVIFSKKRFFDGELHLTMEKIFQKPLPNQAFSRFLMTSGIIFKI